jgi:RNA polymerase sigma-70 factor (ECF subfamily)
LDEIASLIESQIPTLRRYAFALARDHGAADDLVQDCLERAVSRWVLRRRDGDLRAWLFTILRNLYINQYHRQRRQGRLEPLDDINSPAIGPTQEAGLGMRDILSALNQLPEDQKSVLLLVAVEDLSYDETARVLDIPVGTVMSRLSRARQRLRTIHEAGCVTPLRRIK